MLLMSNGVKSEVKEVGVFMPKMTKIGSLGAGDVGFGKRGPWHGEHGAVAVTLGQLLGGQGPALLRGCSGDK